MKLINRMKTWAGMEHRDQDVGQAVIDALQGFAEGTGVAHASATAAVQTATRMIADPFRHRHCPGCSLASHSAILS